MPETNNVTALPGHGVPGDMTPNEALIAVLERALEMARAGRLRSFIGTGYLVDGLRYAMWVDTHPDVYQMLGSLTWLQSEYINRHTVP